jgi:leucyl aminopeptidase
MNALLRRLADRCGSAFMFSTRVGTMLEIQSATTVSPGETAVALPVARPAGDGEVTVTSTLIETTELIAFARQVDYSGAAGEVQTLYRPLRSPATVIVVGIGEGDEAGWRAAGAALARSTTRATSITVDLTSVTDTTPAIRGFAEGAWLADYRFGPADPDPKPSFTLLVAAQEQPRADAALGVARAVAARTNFARTLTNTPSIVKCPEWFVDQVRHAAGADIEIEVWEPERLAVEGFNGILAVGRGSDRGPRLLQLDYAPPGATRHVVLVGKGITFDTGGIDIKPAEAMTLMRKDMGGAAAVVGALLAAADLRLPVRVTALTPLAENMLSGRSWRPGDVVKHYGGLTSEVRSTDAEGRVVLGDAMAYAVRTFSPDYLIDLATLTGSSRVALGKRIAALFSEDEDLVEALTRAAGEAGEAIWQLPLPADYMPMVTSDIADLYNSAEGGAGTITAALFLREFAGEQRDRWAHVDMSSPSWSDEVQGELPKGATGWGVRTLVRFLGGLR